MSSRRDFLKQAMLFGVAGFAGGVPRSIQRAFSIDPEPGSSWLDAEHIVILMQENRSFDHAFGSLQGVRGFNDPRTIRLPNGNSVFLQTNAKGETYAPWRLDIKDTRATWMGSIPHSRHSQVDAWNGGNANNWIDAKRSGNAEYATVPLTMGHYTREDLPFYYALADAFTVCDQHYCGVMSSTHPNRLSFMTGTVRDHQSPGSKVYMQNQEIAVGGLQWSTFPERLQKAGISWKYYQNDLTESGGMTHEQRAWLGNFGTNVLEYFSAYNVQFTPGHQVLLKEKIAKLEASIKALQEESERNGGAKVEKKLKKSQAALEKLNNDFWRTQGGLAQLSEMARDLNGRAFVTNAKDLDFHALEKLVLENGALTEEMEVPKGDILYQFREDVRTGKLPTVSWLSAPGKFSDHPSSPWYGVWYVSEVMDILTRNSEVWKKTIFILTYDENDGYFDHAPSFVAADPRRKITGGASDGIDTGLEYTYKEDELAFGVPEDVARSGPIGLAFRVPMIIASPWSRGGWVNSQVFEHSSTIQFVERFVEGKHKKNVRETNISPWRRAVSGDLTSIFRKYDGTRPKLPYLNRDEYVESIQRARYKQIPSNYRALSADEIARVNRDPRGTGILPLQEPGVRQACALPYEPYADGHLSADGKGFELELRAGKHAFGERAAGVPFNVYLYGTTESTASTAPAQSQPNMISATYAVKAGTELKKSFDLSMFSGGKYDIEVHGPNGFFRRFMGSSGDPGIEMRCAYELAEGSDHKTTGNLELSIVQKRGGATVEITDRSYGAEPIRKKLVSGKRVRIPLDLTRQHSWYDFSVRLDGAKDFEQQFAGHVETGGSSYTDPLMGQAT